MQQKCQNATIPTGGCGSLSNRTCVCSSSNPSIFELGKCETATCSFSDLQRKNIFLDLTNQSPSSLQIKLPPPSGVQTPSNTKKWKPRKKKADPPHPTHTVIQDLAYLLCNPVGGITNNNTATNTSSTFSATASPPAPTAFTGAAARTAKALLGWSILGLMGSLGWHFLL